MYDSRVLQTWPFASGCCCGTFFFLLCMVVRIRLNCSRIIHNTPQLACLLGCNHRNWMKFYMAPLIFARLIALLFFLFLPWYSTVYSNVEPKPYRVSSYLPR